MVDLGRVCQAEPVVDMTNRLLAQCMRQCGLTKIYRKLMRCVEGGTCTKCTKLSVAGLCLSSSISFQFGILVDLV